MKKNLLISIAVLLTVAKMHAQQLVLTTSVTPATACTPPCNGTATVTNVSGGTPPYTYVWNVPGNPQQTQTATGLCPGQWQVGVWDATTPFPNQGTDLVTITCSGTTGINTFSVESNMSIFPNPAQNVLTIETNSAPEAEMEVVIRNILGMEAYRGTIPANGNRQLDISAFPAGVYAIEFINRKEIIRSKFIKQ